MNEFRIRVKLLNELLQKKQEALSAILNICENEETVITNGAGGDNDRGLLRAMAEEKQSNINIVLESDEIFETTFSRIRDGFEQNAKENKEAVTSMKALISAVCDLDIKIRLKEEQNKKLLDEKNKRISSFIPKEKVAKLYAAGNSQKNHPRPEAGGKRHD